MKYHKRTLIIVGTVMIAALAFTGCSTKKGESQNMSDSVSQTEAPDQKSEIELGDYKGISVSVEKLADITDADVETAIQTIVDNSVVNNENKSRAAAQGDTVNVAYAGYLDGAQIPDSAVEDYNILIGSGIFFDGAESQLIGVMPGSTVDIPVTFPDSYPKAELIGKSAIYKVTLNYIVEEGQSALTDEFVASISDCKTVDEFRSMMKDSLTDSKENERRLARQNAVWEKVMENAKAINYSASEVSTMAAEFKSYDESAAKDFDMTLEAYVKEYQNMSMDEYNQSIDDIVKAEIKKDLVTAAIAKAEGITSDNMTEEEITRCSAMQGYDSVDVYKESRGDEGVKKDVLTNRVLDFAVDSAKITETAE